MINYFYIENGEDLEKRIIDKVNNLSKNYKNITISELYEEIFLIEDGRYLQKKEVVKISCEDKGIIEKIIERLN